jgi:hypothetical protein
MIKQVPAEFFLKYYLYVNHPTDRARVHKDGCSREEQHGGKHRYNQGYWKVFDMREDAFAEMARSGKKDQRGCSFCAP